MHLISVTKQCYLTREQFDFSLLSKLGVDDDAAFIHLNGKLGVSGQEPIKVTLLPYYNAYTMPTVWFGDELVKKTPRYLLSQIYDY